jgi:4'-phosphopantetheinyl transferase EntD
VLDELLPAGAQTVELREDPAGIALYAEERACVARAVEARRREFATGRHCARAALARLGFAPAPIVKDALGGPRWPDGVVGSITHCAGYRAAAVARASDLAAIGIDAEPAEPLPPGVLDLICMPRERAQLAELATGWPGVPWDRLLFSAKESVYKAWAPVMARFLDFDGAGIRIDPATATFTARLLVPGAEAVAGPSCELPGRFAIRDGLIATAVARLATVPAATPGTELAGAI